MATRGKALVRYTALAMGDDYIPAVSNLSLSGRSTNPIDATDLSSSEMEYLNGLPSPGTLTGQLHWNPSDPIHRKFEDALDDTSPLRWSIYWEGAVTNGRYTKMGRNIASGVSATVVTKTASEPAKFVTTSNDGIKIATGDYLKPASGDTLIVQSIVGSDIFVVKSGTGDVTAVGTATNFEVTRPAVQYIWDGVVSEFNYDGGSGEDIRMVSFTITLSGKPEMKRGTPDIG